jgi:hypothetical protein
MIRGKITMMFSLGVVIGIMFMFFVGIGCRNQSQQIKGGEVGQFQIINIGNDGLLMVDTKTGETKIVAYVVSGLGAHQFGISFENMDIIPKPAITK